MGETHHVSQGNCDPYSHAAGSVNQYAYDFPMSIGTAVRAGRSGTVFLIEERFTDGNRRAGEENYVRVLHPDGTLASYLHLTRNGALVELGQAVVQGQVIGLSGDTGASNGPHLHFHLQACAGCAPIPVTFRNTRPHPAGLIPGESYTAEPF